MIRHCDGRFQSHDKSKRKASTLAKFSYFENKLQSLLLINNTCRQVFVPLSRNTSTGARKDVKRNTQTYSHGLELPCATGGQLATLDGGGGREVLVELLRRQGRAPLHTLAPRHGQGRDKRSLAG